MIEEIVVSPKRAPGPPFPTMRDVLAVLFRQHRIALGAFLGIFLAVMLYGWLAPAYESHMKLLVRRGRLDPVVTPQANAPLPITRAEISEEELNSEVELLRDEEILRKVVEANGLAGHNRYGFLPPWKQSEEGRQARAVRSLARALKADPVKKTNMISVRYDAADPALAARVLNTLARLYVEKHTAVHRPSGEFHFFEQETERSREQLGEAEGLVLDFSRGEGVVSAALERDLALQKLSEIDASCRQLQVQKAALGNRIQSLQMQVASLPRRSTTLVRSADNAQLLENLKSKLLDLELRRTELLSKYEPSYRLVVELEQQISEAKAALDAEKQAPVREESTDKDPNYEWAKAELEKAQVELSAIEGQEAASRAELMTYQQRVERLGEDAIHQQDLLRAMKVAEENNLLYARKSEEARIGDALDERGILNVALVEAPVAPVLPKRSVWGFGLIGFFTGGVVSMGLAFATDALDPAFRTPDEVVAFLQAPVLASLPKEAV